MGIIQMNTFKLKLIQNSPMSIIEQQGKEPKTMHIYTLEEVTLIAGRLISNGMSLKHAVNLTAAAYGFEPDDLYKELTQHIE